MKAPLSPVPGDLPQFKALIDQLGGGHFTGGGAQIAPIFPNTEVCPPLSLSRARALCVRGACVCASEPVSGSRPSGRCRTEVTWTVTTTTGGALARTVSARPSTSRTCRRRAAASRSLSSQRASVSHRHSCLQPFDHEALGVSRYWRGGHRKVHEWWRAHPEEVDGRFTATDRYEQHTRARARTHSLRESDRYKKGEHPYTGAGIEGTQHAVKAGTVCVWHGWCPHNASQNASKTPRLAIIR